MAQCLTPDRGVVGLCLARGTVCCVFEQVLVQPRKTHPDITEKC